MDNGQFQIPEQEMIQEIESSFRPVEVNEMEAQPSVYEVVKQRENSIDLSRSEATEANLPKLSPIERARAAVTSVFVTNNAPRTLKDKLVEAERASFSETLKSTPGIISQRFFYHDGDWFYETQDSIGSMVARYQFAGGQAHKLVEGRPTAFAEGEVQNLYKMTELYYEHVMATMYTSQNESDLTA